MPAGDLPVVEFAFPGPLRDQLVAAILAAEKTTTTGLVAEYEHANDPLPVPGLREAVVDSGGRPSRSSRGRGAGGAARGCGPGPRAGRG